MTRPLGILHVSTFYPPFGFGGDAGYVRRLAHALADAGHDNDVVHCRDSFRLLGGEDLDVEAVPGHPLVTVHGLESGLGWLSPLTTYLTGRPWLKMAGIKKVLEGRPWDVVHFHNTSLFGPALLALDAGDAVKLYTAHEHWLVCPTHVLWKNGREPCDRPECLRCTLLSRRPPQPWRWGSLLARSAEHVDAFLAPSRFCARMHAERGFPDLSDLSRSSSSAPTTTGGRPGPRPTSGRTSSTWVGWRSSREWSPWRSSSLRWKGRICW